MRSAGDAAVGYHEFPTYSPALSLLTQRTMPPAEKSALLISEVARQLRLKPRDVHKHLPITLIGGKKRILPSELQKYLASNTRLTPTQRPVALMESPDVTLARLRAEGIV